MKKSIEKKKTTASTTQKEKAPASTPQKEKAPVSTAKKEKTTGAVVPDQSLNSLQANKDSTLINPKTMKAIVVLPDGLKHDGEKIFHFFDGNEPIYFRGYTLENTKLATLQKAVSPTPDESGYIEYVSTVCTALNRAGYKCMACNEEGMMTCANLFNADAWAFTGAKVRLFGPVILMKRME